VFHISTTVAHTQALERALTKDTMGRINYFQLEALVQAVTAADQTGEGVAEPAAE
jgi:hypothetical protein